MNRQDLFDYNEGFLAHARGEDRDDNESHYWTVGWDDAEAEEVRRNL